MKAHQLIRMHRSLILLVLHLSNFANASSVLVKFHKLYVCAQHIQRFGHHRGLTPGASSSHVGSRMTPPPYVLSQGVLAAIGNALLQAFAVGIGTSHEANKPHHEARPRVPFVRQRSKAQRPSEGHARTIIEGRWDDGLSRPLHLERGMAMEYMLMRTSL
ncbi:unnamed protein product [Sphagnum tenellum]